MAVKSSSKSSSAFPFSGELFPARTKKFQELIFFVHFYDGSKKQILRHIRLANSLGFDAFAFHLEGHHQDFFKLKWPLSPTGNFGVKHVFADQIESLLNLLPQKKIVFSFSNPSAAAIEAIARRNAFDIKALICDSGPSHRFLVSAINLYQQKTRSSSRVLNLFGYPLAPILGLGWSPYLHRDLYRQLANFPEGFPVLSIQGGKDALIAPEHIEEVFKPHANLSWKKLDLPDADHLLGLRDFRAEYAPVVEEFLLKIATPV